MTEPTITESDCKIEQSPNDSLASIVTKKLTDGGHITANKTNEVLAKLKAGTATAQDWRLWAELAITKKEEELSDGAN